MEDGSNEHRSIGCLVLTRQSCVIHQHFVAGILGGGFLLGSVVMVMEDSDAPHHLLLLRAFMAQGVLHKQPLLFAGPMKEPRSFLGALPAPVASSKEDARQRAKTGGASNDGRASVCLWMNVFHSVLIFLYQCSYFLIDLDMLLCRMRV